MFRLFVDNMYRILIIDDSPADCEDLGRKLACFEVEMVTAMSLKMAKELLKKSSYRDIIICDYKLTDGTSVELLEWLAKNRIYRDVIVVSDMPDNPLSIEAFRAGAKDYIQKRQTDQLLIPRLKRLIGGGFESEYKSVVLPRSSAQFNEIQRIIAQIAPTRLNVLITGEGGCGKEPLAQEIYRMSNRSDRPCMVIDSAMLPMMCPANNKQSVCQVVEDYFAKAEHGTVILDHIHLLPFEMQTIILNLLDRQRPDIRLIATTNAADIAEKVIKGEFRQGLYYTLRQTHIDIPPLRECKEDIIPLAEFFLQRYSYEFSRRIKGFDTKAKKKLSLHTWPGNIRELKHAVRFAVIEATGDVITSKDLDFDNPGTGPPPRFTLRDDGDEKARIIAALQQADGKRQTAADLLGISRVTLNNKINKYEIGTKYE